jgi:hypothetical protein
MPSNFPKHIVVLGDGRMVTAGVYARAIKTAKSNPDVWFARGFNGWGAYGRDLYDQWRYEILDDIINKRGGLVIRTLEDHRLARKRAAHLSLTCAWCGQPIQRPNPLLFLPRQQAFCSDSCQRDYAGS